MNELEAKYLVAKGKHPNRLLRRVLQELAWAGYLAHPRGASDVDDVYFDTADWQLRKAGWTYRLRDTSDGFTLTLKQLAGERHNIFERQEINQVVAAAPSHPERPGAGPVADELSLLLSGDAPLRVLFLQRNHRQKYQLTHPAHPHADIELVLDLVAVDADPPLRYCEMEFELREGPVNALQDLAAVMEQQDDLIPARVSKYQRGLQATGNQPPPNRVWQHRSHDVRAKWIELAIPHLSEQRAKLKTQEPYAWEAVHIEGVHQLRVTTRRVRAALRAFANVLPKKSTGVLLNDIRWLTDVLGKVRDLDVQLENLRN